MTCKDADKLIPLFLEDDLDNRDLAQFLDHVEHCPECKEELTIQFLVRVGMQRLEDGNTFNLKYELDNLLKDAQRRLNFRKKLVLFSYGLEFAVVAMSAVTLFLAIILR
ncbi:anti-sigma factor family protein [Butyrivibrio proteoclasticus]|uniref:anti-sigma factor family protein n=1 Tax=Butyrivibrio proteoclasticus TaxID=43305 RepID=UPI0006890E71|nr:zf-HC2 domain-containing protein [Butyrivibrio proteoclasticus]